MLSYFWVTINSQLEVLCDLIARISKRNLKPLPMYTASAALALKSTHHMLHLRQQLARSPEPQHHTLHPEPCIPNKAPKTVYPKPNPQILALQLQPPSKAQKQCVSAASNLIVILGLETCFKDLLTTLADLPVSCKIPQDSW